jgi:hypothetical protein
VGAAGVAVVVWTGWVAVVLIVVDWTCVVGLGIPKNLTVVGAKGVAPCNRTISDSDVYFGLFVLTFAITSLAACWFWFVDLW